MTYLFWRMTVAVVAAAIVSAAPVSASAQTKLTSWCSRGSTTSRCSRRSPMASSPSVARHRAQICAELRRIAQRACRGPFPDRACGIG